MPRPLRESTDLLIKIGILLLVFTGIAASIAGAGANVTGQVNDAEPVIYLPCYRPPDRVEFGRFPECGIDEAAMAAAREASERRDGFSCLNRAGETVYERSQCAPLEELDHDLIERATGKRPINNLSPEEERAIQRQLDDTFGQEQLAVDREQFLAALTAAVPRVVVLMDSKLFELRTNDRQALAAHLASLNSMQAEADGQLARLDLDKRVADLKEVLNEIVRLERRAVRIMHEGPNLENLVTRIDNLVARVGTVLRDVEREGHRIPVSVQRNHDQAKELVRQSKGECSTQRPERCRHLRTVLELIEEMREPLCRINAAALSFCAS